MKSTILKSLIITLLLLTGPSYSYADTNADIDTQKVTKEDVFSFFADHFDQKIPETYKYINLNFTYIPVESELETALKKLVYINAIKNSSTKIVADSSMNLYTFLKLSEKILGGSYIGKQKISDLKDRTVRLNDLKNIKNIAKTNSMKALDVSSSNAEIKIKKRILNDVYSTLKNSHINHDAIPETKLIDSAIQGLTKGTNDKFTVYFPPVESKNFYEGLNGEYEGIGAYVDMVTPGEFKIISPIPGSPSEKAGLKGGDIVLKVDGKEITEDISSKEVISWIKGPAGSTVELTIQRDTKVLDITVTRAKIIIKDIESKLINRSTYYIKINSFGEHVSENFTETITEMKKNNKIKKVIIDLRNNGGGYLGQVTDMLSHFVKKGEPTAVVKYVKKDIAYISKGYNVIDFNDYRIILLQNSGTASASEVMIGTIKDYFPEAIIVGEKSYGKGSVQTIRGYNDSSFLKYTIAKWFTGKTQTGINEIGIQPDVTVELNIEDYKNRKIDNQLNEAISQ